MLDVDSDVLDEVVLDKVVHGKQENRWDNIKLKCNKLLLLLLWKKSKRPDDGRKFDNSS